MAPRNIASSESLESVRDEHVYTHARLQADPLTRDLAALVTEQLEQWNSIREGQRSSWDSELVTQAQVDHWNGQLDALTREFLRELERLEDSKSERSARFQLYFPKAPSVMIRLGLESQMKASKFWPDKLRGESDDVLKAFAARFETVFRGGQSAVDARASAVNARATYRVRSVLPFVDDVNGLRLSLYGTLNTRASANKLPRDWATGFFLKRAGSTDAGEETDGQPPAPAPA